MDRDLKSALKRNKRSDMEAYFSTATRSVYLGEDRVLAQILGKFKFFCIASDVGFSPHMIFDGYWEYWLTMHFAAAIKPGDVVLDIGANLGYYTLLAADFVGPAGQVFAYEPNPRVFQYLRDTTGVNGFAQRVRLHNVALSDRVRAGGASFFVPRGEPKNGRFTLDRETPDLLKQHGDVFTVSVDTLNADSFERVDFIKIDVEGAEMAVLNGLSPLIEKFRPQIVCEVNFARGYSYADVFERLHTNGQLFHLDYDAVVKPLTEDMVKSERRNDDWLICTNPH